MNKSSIRTQFCDSACYESRGFAVSKETIQKDCMHCSKSAANNTMKPVGVRSAYDMMRSPARLHSSYTEVEVIVFAFMACYGIQSLLTNNFLFSKKNSQRGSFHSWDL